MHNWCGKTTKIQLNPEENKLNPNIYVLLMGQRENKKAKKYGGKKLDGKKPEGNGAKPPPPGKK